MWLMNSYILEAKAVGDTRKKVRAERSPSGKTLPEDESSWLGNLDP
jgi:hypothetical protein